MSDKGVNYVYTNRHPLWVRLLLDDKFSERYFTILLQNDIYISLITATDCNLAKIFSVAIKRFLGRVISNISINSQNIDLIYSLIIVISGDQVNI